MNHAELIEKAKKTIAAVQRGSTFGVPLRELTKTRVRDAVVVYFGRDDREDYFQIMLDRDSGEMIHGEYVPPKKPPPTIDAEK